jgi:hypothetical protein
MENHRMAEGVGFEPTVGFPTLDFESSALNRTQPPFLLGEKRRTSNVEHPTSKATVFEIRRSASGVGRQRCIQPIAWLAPTPSGGQDSLLHEAKNVTIFGLPCLASLLHLVYPHGQPRYYLLLTGIHSFLAPLFTSIPSLFEPQPLSYRHDSTQTRNSARVTK